MSFLYVYGLISVDTNYKRTELLSLPHDNYLLDKQTVLCYNFQNSKHKNLVENGETCRALAAVKVKPLFRDPPVAQVTETFHRKQSCNTQKNFHSKGEK